MGSLVFKTSGAAFGVARWVRLPCAPANEASSDPMTSPARPPSIDAVLRAADGHGALVGRDRAAAANEARRVVAVERERLAAGGEATPVELARASSDEPAIEWYTADHAMRSARARAAREAFLRRELRLG